MLFIKKLNKFNFNSAIFALSWVLFKVPFEFKMLQLKDYQFKVYKQHIEN